MRRATFTNHALLAVLTAFVVGSALGESPEPTKVRITTWNLGHLYAAQRRKAAGATNHLSVFPAVAATDNYVNVQPPPARAFGHPYGKLRQNGARFHEHWQTMAKDYGNRPICCDSAFF